MISPGPARLLEPSRGVDGVAGHQPLARAGVAGDDLAGVDPDVVAAARCPRPLGTRVEGRQRGLHVRGGADRPQRVVLVADRQPEDGHDRIADELLDRPAVPLEGVPHRFEVAGHHLAQRLGLGRPRRPASRAWGRRRRSSPSCGSRGARPPWPATAPHIAAVPEARPGSPRRRSGTAQPGGRGFGTRLGRPAARASTDTSR